MVKFGGHIHDWRGKNEKEIYFKAVTKSLVVQGAQDDPFKPFNRCKRFKRVVKFMTDKPSNELTVKRTEEIVRTNVSHEYTRKKHIDVAHKSILTVKTEKTNYRKYRGKI